MESSRRDLLNNMAEHKPILKNNQNTYPRFVFTPKTGIAIPKTGFSFSLCCTACVHTTAFEKSVIFFTHLDGKISTILIMNWKSEERDITALEYGTFWWYTHTANILERFTLMPSPKLLPSENFSSSRAKRSQKSPFRSSLQQKAGPLCAHSATF